MFAKRCAIGDEIFEKHQETVSKEKVFKQCFQVRTRSW